MKFGTAALALPALAMASQKQVPLEGRSIRADSKMGSKLLESARRLDQNNEQDLTWVVGYDIKFQGCHHVQQWNDEANGDDQPKIQTKRLVRFRLCPSGTCTTSNAGGCDSGYGDYIIDLNLFLEAYWQDTQEQQEWDCEYAEKNTCYDCENDNNKEYCYYDCYIANSLDFCVENNPYEQNNGNNNNNNEQEEFEVDRYMECGEFKMNNRRNLNDQEVQYFIGPYCSDQGGSVYLGVFTDEFCTNFADDSSTGVSHKQFYYNMVGSELPYSEKSLIGPNCVSCKERGDVPEQNNDNNNNNNNNNNNDQQDADEVAEMCEQLYRYAGKCESGLSTGSNYFSPNENACTYMEGIKIMRTDGTVVVKSAAANKTAAAFIGIFATAFVLLGAYVYYLKTKLDRAKVDLSGQ